MFAKPEDVNVHFEYLNLSFLIQKPNGGTRLVTSFAEVGQYSKPQPSLMPDVDSTLRAIAKWRFIILSDLSQSLTIPHNPLAHESMKYCGVATPFKGIRVYTRSAMGMPGPETCLEELISRVLGDLIQEGIVTKLADDLYCRGNTPEEALSNWSPVLKAQNDNNLRLSARKTVICPKSATSPVCTVEIHLFVQWNITCLYCGNSPVCTVEHHLFVLWKFTCLYSASSPVCTVEHHLFVLWNITCLYCGTSPVCTVEIHLFVWWNITCLYCGNSPLCTVEHHLFVLWKFTCLYGGTSPVCTVEIHLFVLWNITCLYCGNSPVCTVEHHLFVLWKFTCLCG